MNILSVHKWCIAFVVLSFLVGTLAGISLVKKVEKKSLASQKNSASGFASQEWRTGVSGKVVSVSENSLLISLRDGSQQTFAIDNQTKVVKTKLNKELKRFDPVQESATTKDIAPEGEVGINLVSNFEGTPRVEQIYLFPVVK